MYHHMPEDLVRLHQVELIVAAQQARLCAVARATRPARRLPRQRGDHISR
jgi:hypothetical protein